MQARAESDDEIYALPFSALAQSCKTYDEYGEMPSSTGNQAIERLAIGLAGPK